MFDVVAIILGVVIIGLLLFAFTKVLNCSVWYLLSCCVEFVVSVIRFFTKRTEEIVNYPVTIGWDGFRVNLLLVNKEFNKVVNNFVVCYCSGYQYIFNKTCIAYYFEIQRKVDSLEDDILISIIQKQAEEVGAKTMIENECYQSAEPLTVVELQENRLIIVYAINSAGITEVENYKNKMYLKKMETTKKVQQSDFWEDWRENE